MEEDPETGVAVVAGLGELNLEVFAERLGAATGLRFRCGRPRIRSRSAIGSEAAADAECRTMLGPTPAGMSASVQVTPGDPDRHARVVVAEGLFGPAAGAAQAALRQLAEAGVSHPHPLFGAEIRLAALGGDAPQPQAAALAAEAAQIALRKAVAAADPFELEPWTRVEILAPREVLSGILADLQSRGGDIELVEPTDLGTQVRGVMPLAAAIGYPTQLRSLSRGLADLLMLPAGYRPRAGTRGVPSQEKAAGDLDRGGGAR
jgi:elongation factor G